MMRVNEARIMKQNITSEEAIIELRNIVKSLTGLDPREGQITNSVPRLSENDTEQFLNELFTQKKAES